MLPEIHLCFVQLVSRDKETQSFENLMGQLLEIKRMKAGLGMQSPGFNQQMMQVPNFASSAH